MLTKEFFVCSSTQSKVPISPSISLEKSYCRYYTFIYSIATGSRRVEHSCANIKGGVVQRRLTIQQFQQLLFTVKPFSPILLVMDIIKVKALAPCLSYPELSKHRHSSHYRLDKQSAKKSRPSKKGTQRLSCHYGLLSIQSTLITFFESTLVCQLCYATQKARGLNQGLIDNS